MIVPAAYCRYAFFGQSIVEVGIEAWTLNRFSPVAAPYCKTAISILRKRDMQEIQG